LSYAMANGGGKAGIIETNFKELLEPEQLPSAIVFNDHHDRV